jgi:hypothetical protein
MAYAQPRQASIYKIYFDDHPDFYIGSTVQRIKKRITRHKGDFKSGRNLQLYNFIREHGDDWNIVKYEVLVCKDVSCTKEKCELEQKYIDELSPTLNYVRAYTPAELAKEKFKVYQKAHHQANKESINKRHRDNYHANIEKEHQRAKAYRESNKEAIKAHREANRDSINQQKKVHYDLNKAQISATKRDRYKNDEEYRAKRKQQSANTYQRRKSTKVKCACGSVSTTTGKPLHLINIKAHQRKHCQSTTYEEL